MQDSENLQEVARRQAEAVLQKMMGGKPLKQAETPPPVHKAKEEILPVQESVPVITATLDPAKMPEPLQEALPPEEKIDPSPVSQTPAPQVQAKIATGSIFANKAAITGFTVLASLLAGLVIFSAVFLNGGGWNSSPRYAVIEDQTPPAVIQTAPTTTGNHPINLPMLQLALGCGNFVGQDTEVVGLQNKVVVTNIQASSNTEFAVKRQQQFGVCTNSESFWKGLQAQLGFGSWKKEDNENCGQYFAESPQVHTQIFAVRLQGAGVQICTKRYEG